MIKILVIVPYQELQSIVDTKIRWFQQLRPAHQSVRGEVPRGQELLRAPRDYPAELQGHGRELPQPALRSGGQAVQLVVEGTKTRNQAKIR